MRRWPLPTSRPRESASGRAARPGGAREPDLFTRTDGTAIQRGAPAVPLSRVTGDRYAAQWPIQAFRKHAISYQPSELNRSQLYAAFEPLLNSGRVELLDHPKLIQQLIGLVRKGDKIDHASGEHDDHSNAAAGVLGLVATRPKKGVRAVNFISGQEVFSEDEVLLRREAAQRGMSVDTLRHLRA